MNKTESSRDWRYNQVSNNEIVTENEKDVSYGYGYRHIQLIILFLCLAVNTIQRGHMGVTIVAITSKVKNNITIATEEKNNINNITVYLENVTEQHFDGQNETIGKLKTYEDDILEANDSYDWPKSVQEMALNAFFLGYAIMMFPMGIVCQRFGGKIPLQISLLNDTIVSMITPWLITWGGWKALCCCRILQGVCQAGTYPSVQALLAKWVPECSRATLVTYVYTGVTVGTVVGYQVAGFLGASSWSWPSTFYFTGILSFLCFNMLTIFGAKSPQTHKFISEEEKKYIMGETKNESCKRLKTPWSAILTSKPVWGTIATHVANNVTFVFYFNQIPSYTHHILGTSVENSGLLSSIPYIVSFFSCLGFGWTSDYLTNNNIISKKNCRRIFNTISQSSIIFCLIMTYTENITVAVSCLIVTMAANMAAHVGWMVTHIDMSPNFSGTLMANGNTLANIGVVVIPIIVSHIITDMTNIIQWRIMFSIVIVLSVTCNLFFVFLMSTDVQAWNYAPEEVTCKETPEEDS